MKENMDHGVEAMIKRLKSLSKVRELKSSIVADLERWLSWSKALDSKSSVPLTSGTVGSNPTLSASWEMSLLARSLRGLASRF